MRRASILLILLLVSGCSGLMQNIGARWVTRQLTAEFDLDDAQSEAARAAVDRLIAKAPAVLGPPVDVLVASADRAIATGLTESELLALERQVDSLIDEVARHVVDEAAPIVASLRDEQIDHAAVRFDERFDEVRKKLDQSPHDRLKSRQDRFVEAVEDWSGELKATQERALMNYVATLPAEGEIQLKADVGRVEEIEAVLRKHPGTPAVRDALWTAWTEREDWGPEARPPSVRRAENRQTLLYVYGMMTPQQKDHASGHLHDLHDKLNRFLGMVESKGTTKTAER